MAFSGSIMAQKANELPPPNYIQTIIFQGNSEFSRTPVIKLNGSLILEFDDIIGDEANYYYKIAYFDYDWEPSELVQSEFMDGFDNIRITNYKNSYNTLQLYSHYKLKIPNKDTRGLKVSGNYMLQIYNEAEEMVFSRKFMVYQPLALVDVKISRSRDVRYIHSRQTVNFSVDAQEFILKNPEKNVRAAILQNNNLKTGIYDVLPQYSIGNKLQYKYDQETSFPGGNEYLAFDSKDLRAATSTIQEIEVRELYHHFLYPTTIRALAPYTYNPDINGNFKVHTMQGKNPAIEAEYIWTHFALKSPESIASGELHLYGAFNNYKLDESTLMHYNPNRQAYETARLFKQGFYNYKYVLLLEDGTVDTGFISGNFEKTENQYSVLIYYREIGGRYDQIIGFGTANSSEILD